MLPRGGVRKVFDSEYAPRERAATRHGYLGNISPVEFGGAKIDIEDSKRLEQLAFAVHSETVMGGLHRIDATKLLSYSTRWLKTDGVTAR